MDLLCRPGSMHQVKDGLNQILDPFLSNEGFSSNTGLQRSADASAVYERTCNPASPASSSHDAATDGTHRSLDTIIAEEDGRLGRMIDIFGDSVEGIATNASKTCGTRTNSSQPISSSMARPPDAESRMGDDLLMELSRAKTLWHGKS